MQEYVPATVDHWVSVEGANEGKGLTLCNMQYVDEVAQNIGDCTASMIAYRDGLKKYEEYYEVTEEPDAEQRSANNI